mgnify:CR=1 FL=1
MVDKKYVKSPMNYTGGKYKLLHQIEPLFPEDINPFVDLFTGGGNIAVNVKANKIVANDCEENIIGIYKTFQGYDNVDELIGQIEEIIKTYGLTIDDTEAYNKFRKDYNCLRTSQGDYSPLSSYNINILLYVLICYSFNHQYRFNSKGEFNMPFGKERSQWNENMKNNLIKFHQRIKEKDIVFLNKDFRQLKVDKLGNDDFVYCDPPYLITCATYNEKDGWNQECEEDLLKLLDELDTKKIKFALSNVLYSKGKTNDLLIEWSKKYTVHHLDYTYQNCNYHTKDKTNKSDEVLITNY